MSGRMGIAEAERRLRSYLEDEGFGPQDRIHPERALAATIGCSRETIRRALRTLENEGLVWSHQGKGTFIGPAPASVDRPVQRVIETASTSHLIEARRVYEPALAAAAAQSATADDIRALRDLARGTGTARDWREYEHFDDAFHKAVARASANPLLIAIFLTLASVRGRAPWQRQHDALFRKAGKHDYAAEQSKLHLAIVDAIEARDGEAARRMMLAHLDSIRGLFERT